MTRTRLPVGPAVLAAGLALLVVPIVVTLALLPGGGSGGAGTAAAPAQAPAASAPATTPPPASVPIVPPPRNAYVDAAQSGNYAVGLAVTPGRRLGLTVSVLSGQGQGVDGLRPTARVEADRAVTAPLGVCGRGCYRASVAVRGAPRRVVVRLASRGAHAAPLAYALPPAWPPRRANALLERATRSFSDAGTVTVLQTLSGGIGATVVSTWHLESPDRLSYTIAGGGPQGIVIGGTRWDRPSPRAPWQRSPQTARLQQPKAGWVYSPTNVYLAGPVPRLGPSVVAITLLDRLSQPIWFTVDVDTRSGRPLGMRMTTTSHFMTERYSNFGGPRVVRPPSAG